MSTARKWLLGAAGAAVLTAVILQWVFFNVWNGYGYWVWVSGGTNTGSW